MYYVMCWIDFCGLAQGVASIYYSYVILKSPRFPMCSIPLPWREWKDWGARGRVPIMEPWLFSSLGSHAHAPPYSTTGFREECSPLSWDLHEISGSRISLSRFHLLCGVLRTPLLIPFPLPKSLSGARAPQAGCVQNRRWSQATRRKKHLGWLSGPGWAVFPRFRQDKPTQIWKLFSSCPGKEELASPHLRIISASASSLPLRVSSPLHLHIAASPHLYTSLHFCRWQGAWAPTWA